jgi:hypothetical protein
METDLEYFSRRASDERAAAERASISAARTAHAELAARYLGLAARLRTYPVSPEGGL